MASRRISLAPALMLLGAALILSAPYASSAVVLNSSEGVELNVTLNNQVARFNATGLEMNNNDIYEFFADACSGNELVKGVYADGSYNCTPVSTLSTTEDLQETLQEGDKANNQIINMTGSNITDIGRLKRYFQSSTCASGQVVDGINADGSYQCVDVDEGSTVENLSTTLNAGDKAFGNINFTFTGNITNINRIEDFFASACGSGQVVDGVNADGSYSCVDPAEDIQTEDLNQTLLAGNEANQSIDMMGNDIVRLDNLTFNNGLAVGNSNTVASSGALAVGPGATATASDAVAIGSSTSVSLGESVAVGSSSTATDWYTSAFGHHSDATGQGATALGYDSRATADYASTLGYGSDATSQGAVAIGRDAQAPNAYEATFGNLGSEKLDVNVTGNLTVHGSGGLEFASSNEQEITGFFDAACGTDEAVKRVYPNGTYLCTSTIDTGQDVENLNQTLLAGNEANQSIDMMNNNIDRIGTLNSGGATAGFGGDVEIPNGSLNMGNNSIRSTGSIEFADGVAQNHIPYTPFRGHLRTLTNKETLSLTALGISFSNDGKKMYANTGSVYQYELSDAWDITTATQQETLSFGIQTRSTAVSNDGKKFFVGFRFRDYLYAYKLSEPYNISTGTLVSNKTLSGSGRTTGIEFDNQGSSVFILRQGGTVYEYNLPSAFNVSSWDLETSKSVTSDRGLAISSDGRKLYIGDSPDIHLYRMSSPFDLSSASFQYTNNGGTGNSYGRGIAVSGDGRRIYQAAYYDDHISQHFTGLTVSSGNLNMDSSGITNITKDSSDVMRLDSEQNVKIPNGNLELTNNNISDVNSIDGGGDAVRVEDDIDTNGNSVTSSGGEICIGDECS